MWLSTRGILDVYSKQRFPQLHAKTYKGEKTFLYESYLELYCYIANDNVIGKLLMAIKKKDINTGRNPLP